MPGPSLRTAVFLLILVFCVLATNAAATELVVHCIGPDAKPARVNKAELLVSGWGYAASVPLLPDADTLRMPLDKAGVRELNGDDLARIEEIYLYIEAEGCAAVRSASIRQGGPAGMDGTEADAISVFSGIGASGVKSGDVIETDARLRKPVPRFLQLVDDDGRPVPGVEVICYMYWSSANHCARLLGAELLGTYISGDDGTVAVPDGDMEYAFEIAPGDMGLVLKEPELRDYPERLITYLNDETTVVRLHRRERVSLAVHVTRNGVPAPGETLYGCMADCPGGICASCCGPLAVSGADGAINMAGFIPEAYERIYFEDGAGKVLYEADPSRMEPAETIMVELGPGDPE